MIKVEIKKNNIVTNAAQFETQELADAWLGVQVALKSFGLPERPELNEQGEPTGNILPAEYTVEQSDITAEVAAEKKLLDRAKKRAFGEQMIDMISSLNDSKNLTVEQVDAFMSNALIVSLREHLWAGNISTFVAKLTTADVSAFFNQTEKAMVINKCQDFLATLGE